MHDHTCITCRKTFQADCTEEHRVTCDECQVLVQYWLANTHTGRLALEAHKAELKLAGESEGEIAYLKESLGRIYQTSHGIMPLHKDEADLREKVIAYSDARWTRLFAICMEAKASLGMEACHE